MIIGKDIAKTKGKIVYKDNIMELLYFAPKNTMVKQTPVVILTPWIKKYYIFDLNDDSSFVKFNLSQNRPVFITSWQNPKSKKDNYSLDDYLQSTLNALSSICPNYNKFHMMGYCIAGTFLTLLMSYLSNNKSSYDFKIQSCSLLGTIIENDYNHNSEFLNFINEKTLLNINQRSKRKRIF